MTVPLSVSDLLDLSTERRNPRTTDIDLLPVPQILSRINKEDQLVAMAVERELPNIADAVECIVASLNAGGRLIYIGAGTSGRLGVLDASECPPTFSVPPEMVIGLIAGGDAAIRSAVEGAEDNFDQGKEDLRCIELTSKDSVVGVTVSGRTPYVIGALDYAKKVGASTVALTCAPNSRSARRADISIAPAVGPEILTGSTRLKSGTAQKMVLNMLSTAAMIRIGKTFENLMVDVSVSNRKLQTRAIAIIREATGATSEEAELVLNESGNEVKVAIVMKITGLNPEQSRAHLEKSGGFLRKAITASCQDGSV